MKYIHTFIISGSQSQESLDHLFSLARLSVTGSPDESLSYGVANEMLVEHRNLLGRGSFIIFPQLWNPKKKQDRRCDIIDIGLGRLTTSGGVYLQGGL